MDEVTNRYNRGDYSAPLPYSEGGIASKLRENAGESRLDFGNRRPIFVVAALLRITDRLVEVRPKCKHGVEA